MATVPAPSEETASLNMGTGLVREALEGAYAAWGDALRRKDLPGLLAPLAPAFCWHLPDGGRLDRAETEAALSEHLASVASIEEVRIALRDIAVEGGRAIVFLDEEVVSTAPGAAGRAVCRESYRDVWEATADGWRLASSHLLASETDICPT